MGNISSTITSNFTIFIGKLEVKSLYRAIDNINCSTGMPGYSTNIFSRVFLTSLEEKFTCHHCRNVLKNPIQTYCGHRYCGRCFEALLSSTITRFCRPCLEEEYYSKLDANNVYPDLAISQDLGKCTVSCLNKECSWTGSYKEYHQEHFTGCTSAFRMCEHNGCGKQIRRDKVTEHSYQCDMMFVPCPQCSDYCRQKDLKNYNGKCGQCYHHEQQRESTSADTVVTGNDNRRRMQTTKIDIFKMLVLILSITFMYTCFC